MQQFIGLVRGPMITEADSFSTRGEMLSGPVALFDLE